MSRIRDIGNILSASTAAATDAEVASAIAAHNSLTTSVHGISDTSLLATQAYVQENKGIQSGNSASRPASPANGDVYSNTQTGFLEVYSSTYGWEQIGGIASTVTGVTATNLPSDREYNNGAASIAFTPGTVLGRSYTVTSSPGSYIASGPSSPITVTGLQSSTQYTYTVIASNNYGTSSASSASSGVTATTVPQAPSISALPSSQSADITITPGATGGSAITEYTITSDPVTTTQTTSNIEYSFTGLTDGISYTFTARATNANGTSAASAVSNSVTPSSFSATGAYDALATVSLSTATSSVTFSGIPTGYKHLEVRGTFLASATNEDCLMRLSEDTSANYSWHELRGDGSSASSRGVANTSFMYLGANSGNTTYPFSIICNILDYNSSSKYKTMKSLSGQDRNGVGGGISLFSGNWRSLNQTTSITIYMASGTFNQYSQFALYGVK